MNASKVIPGTFAETVGDREGSRWRRRPNALTIAACGALLMFVTALAAHATGTPHPLAFGRMAAIHFHVTATLVAPAFAARATECDADATRRSIAELRPELDDVPSLLPDLWLDDEDDEHDDDVRRTSAVVFARLSPEDSLDLRPPAPEGSPVPDQQRPRQFLTESVRRM